MNRRLTRRRLIGSLLVLAVVLIGLGIWAYQYFTRVELRVELPPANDATLRGLLRQVQDELVHVEGGRFTMGETKGTVRGKDGETWTGYYSCSVKQGEAQTHPVELDGYHISAYETTYEEQDVWAAFTDSKPVLQNFGPAETRSSDRPAGTRTWREAKDYCTWLGDVTGLPFDLPTEAQWEYAARSRGRDVPFATYNGNWRDRETYRNGDWRDDPQFLEGEWEHPHPKPPPEPLPVGTFPPNPLGLYDMTGNVHEWVNDWYDPNYYKRSPVKNPQGPETGEKKVTRGGSHRQSPHCNTVYDRYPQKPANEATGTRYVKDEGSPVDGFRCALNLDRRLESGELVRRAHERGYLESKQATDESNWWPF